MSRARTGVLGSRTQAEQQRGRPVGKASVRKRSGAPPLHPFGLVLHRDGRFTHEGIPITNPRLHALFERSVRFLPEEGKYVVQVGRFRGQLDLEEAGFFVRQLDTPTGTITLSDGSCERLDPGSLRLSPWDGALVCDVKRDLVPAGLPARLTQAAQAELLLAAEETAEGPVVRLAGRCWALGSLLGG